VRLNSRVVFFVGVVVAFSRFIVRILRLATVRVVGAGIAPLQPAIVVVVVLVGPVATVFAAAMRVSAVSQRSNPTAECIQ